jgi:hypothetical protein
MIRSRLAFSIGFLVGFILMGVINYVTFQEPYGLGRNSQGILTMHDPSYSGFPFAMYEHAYLDRSVLWTGVVANILSIVLLSTLFGWVATKIPTKRDKLK